VLWAHGQLTFAYCPEKLQKQDMNTSATLHWDLLYIRTSCKAKHVWQKEFEETPVSAQLPRQIAELQQCGGLLLVSLAEAWLPTAAPELCWSSQLSSPATSHTPTGCVRTSGLVEWLDKLDKSQELLHVNLRLSGQHMLSY